MSEASKMKALFAGYDQAYGTHGKPAARVGSVKQEIKKTALTLRGPVTEELWADHLSGQQALGIIPIRKNGTCCFAAIDVDAYDVNHRDLISELIRLGFNLPVTRSKSGGAHIWIFFKEEAPGDEVIQGLKDIAARLGYGGSEIFPKQSNVMWDRGDFGNWINMPYFGKERAGVKPSGLEMSLREFINHAEASRLHFDDFVALLKKKSSKKANGNGHTHLLDLADGPPCLEHLIGAGFPEGTRNNGLFALGVYARKKYGDNWKNKLTEFNTAAMQPPLTFEEVSLVTKSLEKKDYNYTCQSSPLCQHCNASLCRTRKFGVSNGQDYPTIAGISVLNIDPPIWFVDIGDHKLELTTDEIYEYGKFARVCMNRLHIMFKGMKQTTWHDMVTTAMQDLTEIEGSPELGETGEFMEHLQDFLVNRHTGKRIEDLLNGRPWECVEERRHYFRMRDLKNYLNREGFVITRGKIAGRIEKLGGGKVFHNVKGHGVNTWFVPSNKVERTPDVDPPPLNEEMKGI
jgi:hypothetical protein